MKAGFNGAAAVILAAAILYAMQRTPPLYSDTISPVPVAGEQGERIDTRAFALGVGDVHLARIVKTERVGRTRTYTTYGRGRSKPGEPDPDFGRVARPERRALYA